MISIIKFFLLKHNKNVISSNKDNLFDYLVDDGHGGKVKKDVSDVGVENLKKAGVDVLYLAPSATAITV